MPRAKPVACWQSMWHCADTVIRRGSSAKIARCQVLKRSLPRLAATMPGLGFASFLMGFSVSMVSPHFTSCVEETWTASGGRPGHTESKVAPEKGGPGSHPDVPRSLVQRQLPLTAFQKPWFRIHNLQFDPLYFGSSGDNRFDAPASEYGVLYVGQDDYCAFVETIGHATG